jgi:hypothetical protein
MVGFDHDQVCPPRTLVDRPRHLPYFNGQASRDAVRQTLLLEPMPEG